MSALRASRHRIRFGLSIVRIASVAGVLVATPALASAQKSTPVAPAEKRIAPVAVAQHTAPLRDASYARRALQLTALQEQTMQAVRARFTPAIKAYIAQLNARVAQGVPRDSLRATEDTLRTLIIAERAALDSLLTPAQKHRYAEALRQARALASAPPSNRSQSTTPATATPSSAVPIPGAPSAPAGSTTP